MAGISDETLELNIVINGDKAQQKLGNLQEQQNKLRKSNEDLRKEKLKLIKQGKKETAEYKRVTQEIKTNNVAIKSNSEEQSKLRQQIGLTSLTTSQLSQEQRRLRSIMSGFAPNTPQWRQYNAELQKVNKQMANVRSQMRGTAGVLGKIKSQFSGLFSVITGGLGLVALYQGLKKVAGGNAELSDSQSDVAKTTGLTKTEIDQLTESLKLLDTRTPIKALLALATEAGRLGKDSVEDVEEFVKTADKISVSLGDDLKGDINENVTLIGKLSKQYKVGAKQGDSFGRAMEKIGSSINEVSASGSNQADYLVDYLKRLSGVSAQAEISAQDQIGFAAAFDEAGQSVEVAGTTMSKIIIDMYSDTAEYAKIARKSTEEFAEILAKDSNEALLLFLEGLQGGGEGLSVMTKKMDKLGLEGARSVAVLTSIAENTDNVRAKQLIASRALEEGTSLTAEFSKKNENLAATFDKIANAIGNRFVNSGFQEFLQNVASGILQVVSVSDNAVASYEKQGDKIVDLQNNLVPLIDEYENLKEKTELSKDEQDRMKVIIGQIAAITPTAITAFDEYGNALDISADKARQFLETQKALLQFRNEKAIKEQTDLLKEYERTIASIQSKLSNTNEAGDVVKTTTTFSKSQNVTISEEKVSGDEIAKMQQQLQEYQTKRIGVEASLNELSGDYLEQYAEREKEKTRLTLQELQKRADALNIQFDDSATQEELRNLISAEERKLAILEANRLKNAGLAEQALVEAEKRQKKVLENYIKENQDFQDFLATQRAEREANELKEIERDLAFLDIKHAKEKEKYILTEEEKKLLSAQKIAERETLLKEIEANQLEERNGLRVQKQNELNDRLQLLEEENWVNQEALRLEREAYKAETDEERATLLLERAQLLAQQELDIEQWKELERLRIAGATEEEITAVKNRHASQRQSQEQTFQQQSKDLKKQDVKWTEMTETQKLNTITSALGMAADAFNEGSAAWKAAKIAETTITTYQSAVNAFNSLAQIPIVGTVLGGVAAGLAVASGIKQVQNIAKTPIKKIDKPKKQSVKGREKGLYKDTVDVTRTDGRRFIAKNGGVTSTQLVTSPTYFSDDYIAGEKGPEMVIDAPTFRRLDPQVISHIQQVHRGVVGYENGLYANQTKTSTSNAVENPQQNTQSSQNEMMLTVLMNINNRLENPVPPIIPFGYEEASKIEDLIKERQQSENNGNLTP
ncbi:phage tail tape measure protein [Aquimarina sp. W85]|uniref:phage tail tape measure protein n=1 Tax=Aquimarina rhodophyticola TaxID=3342246 RepID=UPI00366AA4F6